VRTYSMIRKGVNRPSGTDALKQRLRDGDNST
jgi:hypothetical protein